MNRIERQQNNIGNLLELVKENPELEIVPMVSDEIGGTDYKYYLGAWGTAEIDEAYHLDDRIYFRSEDEGELYEGYADNIYLDDFPSQKILSDDEIERIDEKAVKLVKGLPWEKVIVVKIEYP